MVNDEKGQPKQGNNKAIRKDDTKSDNKHQGKGPTGIHSLNSDAAVPLLRFGASNNFDSFKRKVSIACMERYKNLGRLIVDEKYYVPTSIDVTLYNFSNDLISKLSKESLDEIQGHADWQAKKIEDTRDPLDLWITIKKSHQILTTSNVAAVIKKTAREEYSACRQGSFESIMDYKRRFDSKLDALKASGNDVPTPADVAMDFLYGLDNVRYGEFKAEVVNDMQKAWQSTWTTSTKCMSWQAGESWRALGRMQEAPPSPP